MCASAQDRRAEVLVLQEDGGVVTSEVSPLQVESAVDQDCLTRDVTRQIRQQEDDGAGLLIRMSAAPHGDGTAVPLRIILDISPCAWSHSGSGGDCVDTDFVERELNTQ